MLKTFLISNYTRPECGQVTIKATDVRQAVINLIRMTGDSRGICEVKQTDHNRHEVWIQNGWTLIVDTIGEDS